MHPVLRLWAEMRPESSGVLSQALHWVRPAQLPLSPAPLPRQMWPLWLPWFWVQPRAAPPSTLPLVSPALQDPGLTTVSPAAVPSHHLVLASLYAELSPQARKAKVYGVALSADTLMCSCCSASGECLFPGACLLCSQGFYQPLSGQQQCWPCNRGYYAKYTHCARLIMFDVSYCFVYFTRVIVLPVLLGVLYATPAQLVPSTTIPEQTVAQVAPQVCCYNRDE